MLRRVLFETVKKEGAKGTTEHESYYIPSDEEVGDEDNDDVYDAYNNNNCDNNAPLQGHANTKNATTKKRPVKVLHFLQNYSFHNTKLPKLDTGHDVNPGRTIAFILQVHGVTITEPQLTQYFPSLFDNNSEADIHTIFREIKNRYGIDATITLEPPKAIFTTQMLSNTIHMLSYLQSPT